MTQRTVAASNRRYYFERQVLYDGGFGKIHRMGGLLHYYMQSTETTKANDEIASIPVWYQALSARLTYSLKDTYFIEGNVGCTGSENLEPGKQFGWFPAVAMG